jgi:demethylmenaquinone methyltransferase/2-methoxy-6-polyprenyl-1,4-benzoquinol methylase
VSPDGSLNRRIAEQIDAPDAKRTYVRDLFAGVAGRYDLTNDVMSLGLHRHWKKRLLDLAELVPNHRVLDLAAGTGDLGQSALRRGLPGLEVVAADLTPEMMRVGRERDAPPLSGWVAADALALPFPDAAFDRVLIGYGLRNFPDLDASFAEIFRVLRPGGRMVSLDFGHPRSGWVRRAYFAYLGVSTRIFGWALHRDAESYVYIPESLRRFPPQAELAERMSRAGFASCGYVDLVLGTMAIHFGQRPG